MTTSAPSAPTAAKATVQPFITVVFADGAAVVADAHLDQQCICAVTDTNGDQPDPTILPEQIVCEINAWWTSFTADPRTIPMLGEPSGSRVEGPYAQARRYRAESVRLSAIVDESDAYCDWGAYDEYRADGAIELVDGLDDLTDPAVLIPDLASHLGATPHAPSETTTNVLHRMVAEIVAYATACGIEPHHILNHDTDD